MDTSEQYVKMCTVEEIQALQPTPGDRDENDVKYTSFYFLPKENKVAVLKWDNDEDHPIIGDYNDSEKGAIWLPRQDQLQEMFGTFQECCQRLFLEFGLLTHMYDVADHPKFTSLEQLWLAFVIQKKFDKVWTGEEWVKETP